MGLRRTVTTRVEREVTDWKLARRAADRAMATRQGADTREAAAFAIDRTPGRRAGR